MREFIKNTIRHSFLGVLGDGLGIPAAVLATLLLIGGGFCAIFFGGGVGFIPILLLYFFAAFFSTQSYLFSADLPNFFYQMLSFWQLSYFRVINLALASRFSFYALIFKSTWHPLSKVVLSPFSLLFGLFFLVISMIIVWVSMIFALLPFACFFAPLFIVPFVIAPVALSAWGICLALAVVYALMIVLPFLFVLDRISIVNEGVSQVISTCRRYESLYEPTVFADLKTALDSWRIQDRRKILFYQGTSLHNIDDDAQRPQYREIRPLECCLAKVHNPSRRVSLRYLRSSILLVAHYSGYGESQHQLDEPFFVYQHAGQAVSLSLAQLMGEVLPDEFVNEASFRAARLLGLMKLLSEESVKNAEFAGYVKSQMLDMYCLALRQFSNQHSTFNATHATEARRLIDAHPGITPKDIQSKVSPLLKQYLGTVRLESWVYMSQKIKSALRQSILFMVHYAGEVSQEKLGAPFYEDEADFLSLAQLMDKVAPEGRLSGAHFLPARLLGLIQLLSEESVKNTEFLASVKPYLLHLYLFVLDQVCDKSVFFKLQHAKKARALLLSSRITLEEMQRIVLSSLKGHLATVRHGKRRGHLKVYLHASMVGMLNYLGDSEEQQKLFGIFFRGYSQHELMDKYAPARTATHPFISDANFLPERFLGLIKLLSEACARDPAFAAQMNGYLLRLYFMVLVYSLDDQQPDFQYHHAVDACYLIQSHGANIKVEEIQAARLAAVPTALQDGSKLKVLEAKLQRDFAPMIPRITYATPTAEAVVQPSRADKFIERVGALIRLPSAIANIIGKYVFFPRYESSVSNGENALLVTTSLFPLTGTTLRPPTNHPMYLLPAPDRAKDAADALVASTSIPLDVAAENIIGAYLFPPTPNT